MQQDSGYRAAVRRGRDKIGTVLGSESPNGQVMVTAANWLTLFRLAIIPFFWLTFFSQSVSMRIIATLLFILGALSDLWDGKLARRSGQITPFGDFMDPLADKLLVLSAFIALLIREPFGIYLLTAIFWVSLITLREAWITLLRIWIIEGGSSLATSSWGKWKTGIHLTTLILTLVLLNLRDIINAYGKDTGVLSSTSFYLFVNILFFICMIPSIVSGLLYISAGRKKNQ